MIKDPLAEMLAGFCCHDLCATALTTHRLSVELGNRQGVQLLGKTILIIGGYGVFGGKLAQALARDARFDVVVAGRSLAKAEAFCDTYGGCAMVLDTTSTDLAAEIAAQRPFIVVDAAGPFQGYGRAPYRIAKAAIACGAHYLDLSDDAGFTAGIAELDGAARAAEVMVLSGVSSVPAMSSAAVQELAHGMVDIQLIDSVILPGNRAPRGMSVMRAILAQVGKPLQMWRDGQSEEVVGWSDLRGEVLNIQGVAPVNGRRSSLIGAPDLALFPAFSRRDGSSFGQDWICGSCTMAWLPLAGWCGCAC